MLNGLLILWEKVITTRLRMSNKHCRSLKLFIFRFYKVISFHLLIFCYKCYGCKEWSLKEFVSAFWLSIFQVCNSFCCIMIFVSVELILCCSGSKPILQINIWILQNFIACFGSIWLGFKCLNHIICKNSHIPLGFILH